MAVMEINACVKIPGMYLVSGSNALHQALGKMAFHYQPIGIFRKMWFFSLTFPCNLLTCMSLQWNINACLLQKLPPRHLALFAAARLLQAQNGVHVRLVSEWLEQGMGCSPGAGGLQPGAGRSSAGSAPVWPGVGDNMPMSWDPKPPAPALCPPAPSCCHLHSSPPAHWPQAPAAPPWVLLALVLGTSPGSAVMRPPPTLFTAATPPHQFQHHMQEQTPLSCCAALGPH